PSRSRSRSTRRSDRRSWARGTRGGRVRSRRSGARLRGQRSGSLRGRTRLALILEVALVAAVAAEREVELAVVRLEAFGVDLAAGALVARDHARDRVFLLDRPRDPHLHE